MFWFRLTLATGTGVTCSGFSCHFTPRTGIMCHLSWFQVSLQVSHRLRTGCMCHLFWFLVSLQVSPRPRVPTARRFAPPSLGPDPWGIGPCRARAVDYGDEARRAGPAACRWPGSRSSGHRAPAFRREHSCPNPALHATLRVALAAIPNFVRNGTDNRTPRLRRVMRLSGRRLRRCAIAYAIAGRVAYGSSGALRCARPGRPHARSR